MDEELLLARAASGDRAAAGAYLAQHLPALQSAARRIAGTRIDPDDLLADAVEGLLTKWADGGSRIDSPRSYLLASMRNRVINETRSPRSRTSRLDPALDIADPAAGSVEEAIELENELAWLRIALEKLSLNHREALLEESIASVAASGPRSADAVNSLRGRARKALRRAYLQVVLEEGAPPSCHEAIASLPPRVGDTPERTENAPEHLRSCPRCRSRWGVFASLAASLGVAVATVAPVPEAPASAAEPEPESGSESGSEFERDTRARLPRSSARGLATPRTMILGGSALVVGGTALLALSMLLPELRTATPAEPFPAAQSVPSETAGSSRDEQATTIVASMSYTAIGEVGSKAGDRSITVQLDFGVSSGSWRTIGVEFSLPGTLALRSAPEGWSCDGQLCTTAVENARGGAFTFAGTPGETDARLGVHWRADAEGHLVTAQASSTLPESGEMLSTSAHDTSRR